MQWSESIETYIRNKGNECDNISLMHEAEADRNHNINKILTYSGISISFIMALFQIPSIVLEEEQTNLWSYLTLSAFAIQTLIATIIQTGNFSDKKDLNLASSLDFEIMKSNITQQLAIDSSNRRKAEEYQKYIDDLFIKASRYRPYVSKKIRKKFTKNVSKDLSKNTSLDKRKRNQSFILNIEGNESIYNNWQINRFINK